MDTKSAIEIIVPYLEKIQQNNINYNEVWLFGSVAKGTSTEESDIDLAIILKENDNKFETDIKLMTLRDGNELLIEPHTFCIKEFNSSNPVAYSILKSGIKIND